MVQKALKESIKRMCYYLEFYDKNKFFPFEKKRIDVTLSGETINKLRKLKKKTGKPISRIIEEKIGSS